MANGQQLRSSTKQERSKYFQLLLDAWLVAAPPSTHRPLHLFSQKCSDALAGVPPVGQLPDVLCKEPPMIDNGIHNGTKGTEFVPGSVVVYKCKDGFTLVGAGLLQCKAGDRYQGVWSSPAPECRGNFLLCLSCCLFSIFKILISFLCKSSNQIILQRNKSSVPPETASVKT